MDRGATLTVAESYSRGPCFPELVAITGTGVTHVALELAVSETIAFQFSAAASAGFLGYLVWRARRSIGAVRAWGIRQDNFWSAVRAQAVFAGFGAAVMVAYAAFAGSLTLPWSFWLTLALYPAWGVTQQFALQNLLARNVAGLVGHPLGIAAVAAGLFAASHIPRWPLVSLTLVSGFFFTVIYRRVPNLWAVGIAHGFLGSLAVYLVSGEDPGAAIWRFVVGQ